MTIVSTSSVGCEGVFRRNVFIFHQKSPFVAGNFSQLPDRHEVLATGSESGHRAAMIEVARALDVGEQRVDLERKTPRVMFPGTST